jgi:predicted unusual protein kinase regulating ubiquinone biosynthesis (AarF/ABC1/UbiB family)
MLPSNLSAKSIQALTSLLISRHRSGLVYAATSTASVFAYSAFARDEENRRNARSTASEASHYPGVLSRRPVLLAADRSHLTALRNKVKELWKMLTRGLRILLRFGYLVFLFGPLYVTHFMMNLNDTELRQWWWQQMRIRLLKSGPCFAKFAQWLSTQHDVVSLDGVKHLSNLHSSSHVGISKRDVEKMLDEEFFNWRQYLMLCEPEAFERRISHTDVVPVGSGCVAQVIKGMWKDGTPVAIKLVRSNVRDMVLDDIAILKYMYRKIFDELGAHSKSIDGSLEEFSAMMLGQLNLFSESDNLLRFRRNFDSDQLEYESKYRGRTAPFVTFPRPLFPLVSETVLVETFSEGRTLASAFATDVPEEVKQEIAVLGLHAVLKMVFEDNFVHVGKT